MSPSAPRKQGNSKLTIVETPTLSYKVADVAEVEEAAAHMKEPYVQCRDFGHTWTTASISRVKGHYERWLYCKRCKTNRRQTLSYDGEVLETHYEYQEGYQLKGMGRILADGRNAIRRESIERAANAGKIHDVPDEEEAALPVRKRA